MPRRPKDAEGGVDQFGRPLRSAGRALAGVSLRRGRLRRLPAQVLVRASAPREGSAGYDPPAGGSAAGGEGIPAKRGVRTVSQATSGRRTQAGAADATRRSPGTLLRSDEDLLPTPYGRHRRQSHARGDEDRPHARSQPPSDGHLYTCLRFVCVSPRVHNSAATPGARVFGHASRTGAYARRGRQAKKGQGIVAPTLFMPLFTQVRGRRILRTSPSRSSTKFGRDQARCLRYGYGAPSPQPSSPTALSAHVFRYLELVPVPPVR